MHCRRKIEAQEQLQPAGEPTLYDKLVLHVTHGLRGKRIYTPGLVELIAQVGTRPSAGGARGTLAGIISHLRGSNCVQKKNTAPHYIFLRSRFRIFTALECLSPTGLIGEGAPTWTCCYIRPVFSISAGFLSPLSCGI